jgi:hypothetical protein
MQYRRSAYWMISKLLIRSHRKAGKYLFEWMSCHQGNVRHSSVHGGARKCWWKRYVRRESQSFHLHCQMPTEGLHSATAKSWSDLVGTEVIHVNYDDDNWMEWGQKSVHNVRTKLTYQKTPMKSVDSLLILPPGILTNTPSSKSPYKSIPAQGFKIFTCSFSNGTFSLSNGTLHHLAVLALEDWLESPRIP